MNDKNKVRKQIGAHGVEVYAIDVVTLGGALGIDDLTDHSSYDALEVIADDLAVLAVAMNEANETHVTNEVAVRVLERIVLRARAARQIDHDLLVQDADEEAAKKAAE